MESDKAELIDSGANIDVQFDADNKRASFKNLTLVDQSKKSDSKGLADQNLDQLLKRKEGLIVTQNKPSWRSVDFPIILSCFTVVFCGIFFGLAAFILAYFGRSYAAKGDHAKSRWMTRASYALSVAGMVIGIILIIVLATKLSQHGHRSYNYYGCSDYHYTLECKHGAKYDTNGCRECCEMEESCCPSMDNRVCTNGWAIDSDNCRTGCCPLFDNATCNTYGYYYDRRNGGCKQCCSPYDVTSCSLHGFYRDSNGCQTCCQAIGDQECYHGWTYDSNGCKKCCSSYEEYLCTQEPMNTTEYANNGCGGIYKIKDCETNGFYNHSGGYYGVQKCKRCCSSIGNGICTYGWTKDSYGCRSGCCPPYSKEGCEAYGSYYSTYDGCKYCCPSFNIHDCVRFGSYVNRYSSSQCKTCCSPFRSSECQYGWMYDSNQCRRCCDYSEEYLCSHEAVIIPVYNDTISAITEEDTTISGIYNQG